MRLCVVAARAGHGLRDLELGQVGGRPPLVRLQMAPPDHGDDEPCEDDCGASDADADDSAEREVRRGGRRR